jgi:hypothetical protein
MQNAGGLEFMLTRKRFGYLFAMLLIVAFTILYRNIAEGKILHNSFNTALYLPITIAGYPSGPTAGLPVVFVSRQIPSGGSVYYQQGNSMPGVGPFTRFQVAAPGKLLVREPDGSIRTLVDGSNPTAASLYLIDVNAPDVSYDGTEIVFAGLPNGEYGSGSLGNPNAWRIYIINVDGSNLRQVTFSDQDDLDLSQFGNLSNQFRKYDDTDPVWLPDGRIVFSSTRWPAFAQYSGARTTNLHVVAADGSNMRRITAERNSAERPVIDPLTGKIVYSRWWRNHRMAVDSMETIPEPSGGYQQHEGLTRLAADAVGAGNNNMVRNSWHLASINPDGTKLAMWGVRSSTNSGGERVNHAYGGTFTDRGVFYANFFPMRNMTEAAGFGGIRRYHRGPAGDYEPIIGITEPVGELVAPNSFGVFQGNYAGEPEYVPNGQLLISWAENTYQDYGLYSIDLDGNNLTLVYDNPGTTELRPRLIRPRPLPPIIPDTITEVASLLPPTEDGPYDIDGTFTFHALNVYFNAPVDWPVVSAPPVGSAGSIRFYIDHQRHSPGSFSRLDWPILLNELPVNADGSVIEPNAPANVPVFEQIRTPYPDYTVPLTGRGFEGNSSNNYRGGAGHVAGINFAQPGEAVRCVGCHAGHTLIPVPANPEDALWTNLATGAEVTASSAADVSKLEGLVDRRALTGSNRDYWSSDPGQAANGQWVQFTFPVPVEVRTVRLYNPRFGGQANSTIQVHQATVRLYSDPVATQEVAVQAVSNLSVNGTDVYFNDVTVRSVRVYIDNVSGTFIGNQVASLAEVEVIAKGVAP